MKFTSKKNNRNNSQSPRAELRRIPAVLSGQSFHYVTEQEGLWRGYVAGSVGTVRLYLHLLSGEKPEAPRRIGEVRLLGDTHPVRFTFKSAAPQGTNWSWRIIATEWSDFGT